LNVTAKDKATSKEQKITIKGSTELTDEEVEKMRKEAEQHADEDKKKKEKIEIRNQAEALIFTAEKALKDSGDKVKDDVKKSVEEATKELKDVIDKEDFDETDVKSKTDKLSEVLQKIGEEVYKQEQANKTSQPSPDSKSEEKEDKKKEKSDGKKDGSVEEGEVVNE